jgi:hypothetical protein
VWVLAIAGLFALVQLPAAPGTFYPDSTQYLAQTYDLLGETPQAGREKTIQAFCDAYRRPRLINLGERFGYNPGPGALKADECVKKLQAQNSLPTDNRYGPGITRGPAILSHRYEDIFLSRPAVAIFYAPGVAAFGPRMGMWLTTLAWTLLGGMLVFLLLRVIGSSIGAALLGQVLFLILPIRYWTMAPLAEGMTLTLVVLCLLGVAYVMTHRTRRGLILLAAGFGVGLFVKYSQFLLLALALAGTAAIAALVARRAGRPVRLLLLVAGVSVLAAVAQIAVAKMLAWPGGAESMQDLATKHFREADVTGPVTRWLRTNAHFWTWWIAEQFRAPLMIVTWATAAWAVMRSRTVIGFAVFATVLAGLGNQIGHPDASQADRLYLTVWLLVVCGLPLLIDNLMSRQDLKAVEPGNAAPPRQFSATPDGDRVVPILRTSDGEHV